MGTEIEIVNKNLAAIQDVLASAQDRIASVLPGQIKVDRMIAVALELVTGDSNLSRCRPLSILKGVMEASQLGLLLNKNLGHGYLVPYKDEAQFQIGYRGFIDLVMREGTVTAIFARIVYAGEEFRIVEGTKHELIHVPNPNGGELKNYLGAYAVVVYKSNSTDFEWMPKREIEKVRAFSKASKSEYSPWNTWTEAMILKCPIRRICKRLKLSPEVIAATVRDEYRELGYDDAGAPRIREPQMPRRLSAGPATVESEIPAVETEQPQNGEPPAPVMGKAVPEEAALPGQGSRVITIEEVELVLKPEKGKKPFAAIKAAGTAVPFLCFDQEQFENLKAMKGQAICIDYTDGKAGEKLFHEILNWWKAPAEVTSDQ